MLNPGYLKYPYYSQGGGSRVLQRLLVRDIDFTNDQIPDASGRGNYAEPIQSGAIDFNGIDQVATSTFSADRTLPWGCSWQSSTTGQTGYLMAQNTSAPDDTKDIALFFVSGTLRIVSGGGNYTSLGSANDYLDGEPHTLITVPSGSTYDVVIDGSTVASSLSIGSDIADYGLRVGARSNASAVVHSTFFTGSIWSVKAGGEHFPFAETTGLTCWGVVDESHTMTLVVGSGGMQVMRGARQDVYHYNLENGCSLYEHATSNKLRVPYGSDGSPLSISIPAGYSLTYHIPAGNYIGDIETGFVTASGTKDEATLLAISLLSAGGVSFDDYFYDDMIAWSAGTENLTFYTEFLSGGAIVVTRQEVTF